MPRTPHPLATCLLLTVAFALGAPAGADEPVTAPAPERAPGDAVVPPLLPDLPPVVVAPSGAPAEPIVLPAIPGTTRESLLTDAGREAPAAAPTPHELVLLDLARAAVEASRAAGTLYVTPPQAAPAERPAGGKKVLAPSPVSRPLVPDAAAGIGDFPAVQEAGPVGPSEAELEKARRAREEVRHD